MTSPRLAHAGPRRILCIDDDPDFLAILRLALRMPGVEIVTAPGVDEGLAALGRDHVDLALTDIQMPVRSGIDFIRAVRQQGLDVPILALTAQGSIEGAVEALRVGAQDYLTKPIDPERLRRSVEKVLCDPTVPTRGVAEDAVGGDGLLAVSPRMTELLGRVRRVARADTTVLLTGESGTGKELVARAVHRWSTRADGPFVPVHTGAIPRDLIASELFGHERGSFTGAVSAAEGKFDAASKGTLFLDEIGTMDLAVQVALLRVLETFRFTRVGGRRERAAEVRVVAATNRDLADLVRAGTFREDLFYRLNVVTLVLPPLRERPEDVVMLAAHYLSHFGHRHGTPARVLSPGALDRMLAWHWPGNVRELRNAMEQAALFAASPSVEADDLSLADGFVAAPRPAADPPRVPPEAPAAVVVAETPPAPVLDATALVVHAGMRLEEVERRFILHTLDACRGNKLRAAQTLGISRRNLYNKLASYGAADADTEAREGSPDAAPDDA